MGRALFAAAVIVLAVPGGGVSAHAVVDEILPADGSVLSDSPTEVTIAFSEAILDEDFHVELTSTAPLPPDAPVARLDPTDPSRLRVTMPALADGTHQVRVTARDREDLHEVVARTSFAIGTVAPAPSAPVLTSPELPESAARWVFGAGLAVLIGVLAVRTRWPDVDVRLPNRLRILAFAGIATVSLGRLLILGARALSLGGRPGDALATVLGTAETQRLIYVALALACTLPLVAPMRAIWLDMPVRSEGRLSVRLALGWVGVVWIAMLASWGDHSAINGELEVLTAVSKAAHLIGLGLWVGTLAVAIIVNWTTRGARARAVRSAMSAMSGVAVVGAAIVTASGLMLMSRLVISPTGMLATSYGLLLSGKLVAVALAAGLGWAFRSGRPLRLPVLELGVLVGVIGVGTLMATGGPPIDAGFATRPALVHDQVTAVSADDLLVQVRAIPGNPGVNTLEVRVNDTRRPAPAIISGIEVDVPGQIDGTVTVIPNEQGFAFVQDVTLPVGETSIGANVLRSEWPTTTAQLSVATNVVLYQHATLLSNRPWRTQLRVLVLLIVVLLGLVVWLQAVRGRGDPGAGRHQPELKQRVDKEASWQRKA